MHALQFLLRASPVVLLVLCLQLGISTSQENTRQTIKMDFKAPSSTTADEEVSVTLKLGTDLQECMVVKTYLISNVEIEGGFNYRYTICLCNDNARTLFWDFYTNQTASIVAVVDIVRELGICPNDDAVTPIKSNRFYTSIRRVVVS
ncbi:prolactin-inducible protein [Ochotona curzoniae]|uniref:prolactin-inducible protein n=1 Tax=Ochotona curzoniae TaxID=130825 RepID=UPI001B349087|nr:prolactin-inducible protein [Ochotona curzoniae]